QIHILSIDQPVCLAIALWHEALELALNAAEQGTVGLQGLVIAGGLALFQDFFFHHTPSGLIRRGAEVPLIVDVGPGLLGRQSLTLAMVVLPRSVTLSRVGLWRRHASGLHQGLGQPRHILGEVVLAYVLC